MESLASQARRLGKRLWAWLKLGWGIISGVGALWQSLPHIAPKLWQRLSDFDTLRSLWEWGGGDLPTLIALVTSPFFGLGLVVIGLVGIPAATHASDGRRIHPLWAIGGWSAFIVCVGALLSTLLFGGYAKSSSVLAARQYYVEHHTERHISAEQKVKIQSNVCPAARAVSPVSIFSIQDPEAMQYAKEIINELAKCLTIETPGALSNTLPRVGYMSDTKHPGLHVPVANEKNPDKKSAILLEVMKKAGFDIVYSEWDKEVSAIVPPPSIFVSYR